MLRNQCVHEPNPPWKSTSASPPPSDGPQIRQTMAPSPHGVSTRCPAAARRATCAAGESIVIICSSALCEYRMIDAVAALDAEPRHRAAIELENAEHRLVGADRIERERYGALMDVEHGAVGADEQHVERDQRVLHPERGRLRALILEQHPGIGRHGAAVHQTLRHLLR